MSCGIVPLILLFHEYCIAFPSVHPRAAELSAASAAFRGWRTGSEFKPLRRSFSLCDDDNPSKLTLPIQGLLEAAASHNAIPKDTYFRCVPAPVPLYCIYLSVCIPDMIGGIRGTNLVGVYSWHENSPTALLRHPMAV